MTLFFYGADSYRRTHRLLEALRQFTTKYPGLGVRRFDTEFDANVFSAVQELLSSASLFSPRTLIVIENCFALTSKEVDLLIARTATSEAQHLIFVASSDKVPKTHSGLLSEKLTVQEFPVLSGVEWQKFVQREATQRGVQLTSSEIKKLADSLMGDAWRVVRELDVLAVMSAEQRQLRLGEVFRGAPPALSWPQLRTLTQGPYSARLLLLAQADASTDDSAKLFAMAAYMARPRVAADADVSIKTGAWGHDEALLALVLA